MWVPEPAVGGSFAFVDGALSFVRAIVPRLHRSDIKRWVCPEVNGECHLVDLEPATSLVLAEST